MGSTGVDAYRYFRAVTPQPKHRRFWLWWLFIAAFAAQAILGWLRFGIGAANAVDLILAIATTLVAVLAAANLLWERRKARIGDEVGAADAAADRKKVKGSGHV